MSRLWFSLSFILIVFCSIALKQNRLQNRLLSLSLSLSLSPCLSLSEKKAVSLDVFQEIISICSRSTNTKYKPNGELKTSTKGCKVVTMLPPVDLRMNAVNKHFVQWAKTLQKIGNLIRFIFCLSHRIRYWIRFYEKWNNIPHFTQTEINGREPCEPSLTS